jgi:radical SAM-linked protein
VKVQRLRIRYAVTAEALDLGQRDVVDVWRRACEEGAIPLSFSEGKRPSPQISLAAPLPQGVTSTCELVDLHLSERLSPDDALRRLGEHLPCGIQALDAREVGLNSPSVQSLIRFAEYAVYAPGTDPDAVRNAVAAALSARALPSEYRRETKVRHYDLRPLIIDINVTQAEEGVTVTMRLRAEPERAARADQVAALLGLPEESRTERVALEIEEVPAVLMAYRRSGESSE